MSITQVNNGVAERTVYPSLCTPQPDGPQLRVIVWRAGAQKRRENACRILTAAYRLCCTHTDRIKVNVCTFWLYSLFFSCDVRDTRSDNFSPRSFQSWLAAATAKRQTVIVSVVYMKLYCAHTEHTAPACALLSPTAARPNFGVRWLFLFFVICLFFFN